MTRDFATGLDVAKFDYYAGSLDEPVCGDLVVSQLAGRLDAVPTPGPASRGYARCALLRRGDERVAAVRWGGRHAVPHVEASGASSGAVSDIMRATWPHRVSRVDVCVDFDAPGAWDAVSAETLRVARRLGLVKEQAGDWLDPHGRPGEGRTLYVGSRASAVRGRFYEKGRQLPDAGRPDWVRAESQVRPQKAAKRLLAMATPREVLGAAAWSGELFEALTGEGVPPMRVVQYREPDDLRALDAMYRQYGGVLLRQGELYGWEQLGWMIRDELIERGKL